MDRLGRLWPHAEPVEHTLGRLGARSARAARGGEMSRIIKSDDGTFDVDVACRPVRTLHVKDGVSLVVFTTVVPYHPRRPTDLRSFITGLVGLGVSKVVLPSELRHTTTTRIDSLGLGKHSPHTLDPDPPWVRAPRARKVLFFSLSSVPARAPLLLARRAPGLHAARHADRSASRTACAC